ncbi:hypothetical protein RB195_013383 [Necator americanus]|uniref:Ig-like domain-containing protein n=2 Tax=Necator americanus TaxID=51031 RepID=A0ABR1DV82_NECAM
MVTNKTNRSNHLYRRCALFVIGRIGRTPKVYKHFELIAMRYALIVIALAVTVMECSDQLPDCEKDLPSIAPALGKELRKTLSDGVQANMKGGSKPEYNCYLEYLGWLGLNDTSDRSLGWLKHADTYLFNFTKEGEKENKTPTKEFLTKLGKNTNITEKPWKRFGCNYIYKEKAYKYTCIFYHYDE